MEQNLILAGVGGQGILTIARAISIAAMRRGLTLKQAEVHGMAQRGGAVQSHLRISDGELHSDLIPLGKADLILAVEPMESLRYLPYLRSGGAILASSNAFVNIDNYPPIEGILERIARFREHVLIDARHFAKLAGSARSENIVMLGAASIYLELDAAELDAAVEEMFASKGPRVVEGNRRAFRIGRHAALAYRDGLERGSTSTTIRAWLAGLSAEALLAEQPPEAAVLNGRNRDDLSDAEAHAVRTRLEDVVSQNRERLYEHEVYSLVELVGAIVPPRFLFVPRGELVSDDALRRFPGDQVVLKIVSQDIVHKTEARAVAFVPRDAAVVNREIERLLDLQPATARIEGVLVVEFVEQAAGGFGSELFVGIRATREFGPVIAAGLGGVDTEYLAARMLPGLAVAKAVATEVDANQFLELFRRTAAYEVLTGGARGHARVVSDGELLRCFRAFLGIARRFCAGGQDGGPHIAELEVNPFAFRQQRMLPLDGRGRIGSVAGALTARPHEKIEKLIEPQAIAVLGVSASSMNLGRIILNNIRSAGFPARQLYVIKDGTSTIDGVPCVASIRDLPQPVDLLILAAGAEQLPQLIAEIRDSGKVQAVILVPGGVGETEGSEEIQRQVRAAILAGRARPDRGPVFLGPNSLGVQSRFGHYDTFFIPREKLAAGEPGKDVPPRRVALLSQSGAFIISRLSNLEVLNPALAVSIGNQSDIAISDLVTVVGQRDDVDVLGLYVEGFNDLDGVATLRAIRRAADSGKVVVFYKVGRTESGRSAAAGHTAAVAGDYDVCQAAATEAGAIVVDTFKEFEQLIELSSALHAKKVGGVRVGAISNAGFETVGMADATRGQRYAVQMAGLSEATAARLREVLRRQKLDKLVNARNPLDLTPMASEDAYESAAETLLGCNEVDALAVSVVPLTPALLTTPAEIQRSGALTERLPALFRKHDKPMVFIVDCGPLYDPLARAIRVAGIPVFRSCDQAIRSLGRYLCHRAPLPRPAGPTPTSPTLLEAPAGVAETAAPA